MTKRIELSIDDVKALVRVVGYNYVAEEMGVAPVTLRARMNGHLKFTPGYKLKVLKVLEKLGSLEYLASVVRIARKELRHENE